MKNYKDIIDLPHFHAPGRPLMPNSERAAQFMPFKSLKGYDELVDGKTEVVLNTDERQIEDLTALAPEDYFEETE